MSLENKGNVVIDLKNKYWLKEDDKKKIIENGVTERNLDSFSFNKFDEAIEKSFQNFLKTIKINSHDSKETIQMQFNNWLDDECKELDIIKDTEIDEKIIKPVSFELVKEATRTELEDLQKELLEAEKKKTEASVDITVNEGELKWLTKLYNGVTKQEVVNLLGKDFNWRKHLLDLLKVKNSDNIKKLQRIIAWISEDDGSRDKAPETKQILGNTGVDWMFWQHTLNAFKKYIDDNLVETKQNSWVVQQWSDNLPMGDAWSEWFKDSWVIVGDEFQPIVTDKMPAQNNPTIEQYENSINNLQNIDESKAAEIVKFATENKRSAINLGSLKSLTKEVARELAKFNWSIYMNSLEEVNKDILEEFKNGECTMVKFPWGTLTEKDDEISIIINEDGQIHTEITDDVCKLLCKKIWNTWFWTVWAPTWSSSSTTTANNNKKTSWSKVGWKNIEYSWANQEIESAINTELGKIATNLPDVTIKVDLQDPTNTNKFNLYIPKSLWNDKCMNVLYNPKLKQYIKSYDDYFIVPANIKVWLVKKGLENNFVLWDYEWQEWYELLTEDMNFTGEPSKYPWTEKTTFKVIDASSDEWNNVVNNTIESETYIKLKQFLDDFFEKENRTQKVTGSEYNIKKDGKDFLNAEALLKWSDLLFEKIDKNNTTFNGLWCRFAGDYAEIWNFKNWELDWYWLWYGSIANDEFVEDAFWAYVWEFTRGEIIDWKADIRDANMRHIRSEVYKDWREVENTDNDILEQWDSDQRNEYHNLENDQYGEIAPEILTTNYDAIIDYMEWKDNNNLIQAFQKLKINPNSIANALAQILAENPKTLKWHFTKENISRDAMNMLGRNSRRFVNEKNNLVKILNEVKTGKLQQFINEMKVFNDVRELQNNKKFVKNNENKIKNNPFLVLSDFNKNWTLGRASNEKDNWLQHHWRTSEQAMYDVFVSLADTNVWTEKRENGQSYKTIIDWPKTQDLVKWFVSLMKTVWEDRYNDIESEFNWVYTMNKLWEYIVTHRETLVLYQQTINGLSYNSSMDIQDLVSDKRRKSIVDGEIQEIKEISTNRDEVNKRFESQLWKNEEFDKWFKALSAQEQKNFVWNMAVWLDEWWILPTIVKTFWINSKTWVTVDNLDAVDIDFNFFKDDAWIWPRIALIGPLQGGLGFHLDIPIANLTANFDLNHRAVENSVIHGANPVHQLYTRLWANVGWWIVVGWKTDEKLSAYFSAAIEWALWWKADYKKWIELNARNFGNVLQNGIFKDPDFTTKENFKEKAKKSIEDILNWTDKENKNLRKFMKNNKQEMDNCVENVSNLLDVMWAFGSDKKPEHKKILLDSIMKWIVEEVKNQNLWELDWKTKLTRLWIFGQVWWGFDLRQIKNIKSFADFKKVLGFGWSVWLEATLSAWNMIYWPDEEKYNYMDAQLKSWESIKPIGEWIKTNNIENMKNAIAQSLSENSIPNIEVKSNSKNQIEISVTDAVLQKYGKKNIYELFNIYVNPEKKDNVAISEDGKTLTMGWNNLENFSVATRRYFDDFAVYLMIWWKWIDGCGNNKINDETVWEYNTTSHANTVPGFEFTENDTTSQTEQEKTESIWDLFESYNELDDIFTDIEKNLSLMDNWNYWAYAAFMNAAAELGVDKSLDTSDYDTAFENLKNLLKWKLKDNCFDWLKWKMDSATNEEKVMIVDRFKAIFSYNDKLVNAHNLWLQLDWRWDKYRKLHWYDQNADFPLSPNMDYRGEIQKQLNAKWIFERKPNPNLIGMTAFYRLWDKNAWRSYMMTELWWTNVLWWETIAITDTDALKQTQDWFINNLNKSWAHKDLLKADLSEKIRQKFNLNIRDFTDSELISILRWEEVNLEWEDIDIWSKKVKINTRYVFYLLWECANESIWVELWDVTVTTKIKIEYENWEDNLLEVWVDWQTLTKTTSLEQDNVSAKVNVWGGRINWDNWEWAVTHQEWWTPWQESWTTWQEWGWGSGSGGWWSWWWNWWWSWWWSWWWNNGSWWGWSNGWNWWGWRP